MISETKQFNYSSKCKTNIYGVLIVLPQLLYISFHAYVAWICIRVNSKVRSPSQVIPGIHRFKSRTLGDSWKTFLGFSMTFWRNLWNRGPEAIVSFISLLSRYCVSVSVSLPNCIFWVSLAAGYWHGTLHIFMWCNFWFLCARAQTQ